jgi:hypothetical protein
MPKYRKKPVEIEAVQWFEGDQVEGVQDLAMLSEMYFSKSAADGRYFVQTLEGMMQVSNGDWIITGVKGERYPCKPDIFELTHELADPTPPVQPDTPDHAEKLKETSPCHPYAGSIQFPTTQPRDRPQRGDHIHPDTGRTC